MRNELGANSNTKLWTMCSDAVSLIKGSVGLKGVTGAKYITLVKI